MTNQSATRVVIVASAAPNTSQTASTSGTSSRLGRFIDCTVMTLEAACSRHLCAAKPTNRVFTRPSRDLATVPRFACPGSNAREDLPVPKPARLALLALIALLAAPAATVHAAQRMPIGFFDDPS